MILATREPNQWVRPEGVRSRIVEGRVLVDQNNCKQSIQVELYRSWHGEIRGGTLGNSDLALVRGSVLGMRRK